MRTGSEEDMKKALKKARHDWSYGVKTQDFGVYTTNDLPGCPRGGLLLGTDKPDKLGGKDGDDEARGLGGRDAILGGLGDDILYGGPGDDELESGRGENVLYGGDGNDFLVDRVTGTERDKLYCGKGKDRYYIAD